MTNQIAFIGGGNMASALISGLLKNGTPPGSIHVVEPSESARQSLSARLGVHASASAGKGLAGADMVVWAVKPQVFKIACQGVGELAPKALHLSVAAGIRTDSMARWLGSERIVRAMPNTPALIGQGVCGLYARPGATPADRDAASGLIAATGQFIWLEDESLLDAVTALSGSGPAYVFYLMEALVAAGVRIGLSPEQAKLLALGTCSGASALAAQSSESPQTLRQQVTSKGGTTHAAITALESAHFLDIVDAAVRAAHVRAKELGDEFGAG